MKSTHIKCVAGIYRIDGGEFRFDGVRATIHGRKDMAALCRAVEVCQDRETIGAYARRWAANVRGGELGSLPIIVGLLLIAVVVQVQNDRFLTAGNFVNLMVQGAAYALVAMGILFVLLLGEIDLSVGDVSGVAGVLTAVLLLPDGSTVPTSVAILAALGAGVLIGTLHGLIITKIGIPSFVVTLAGLLAWNGSCCCSSEAVARSCCRMCS